MTEKLSSEDERFAEIADNIRRVRENIAKAAQRAGRRPEEVTLVAVTKTKPASDVNAALRCGVTVMGENRVQELLGKLPDIDLPAGRQVHLIGHLQTNKVKMVVGHVDMIQSLDSLRLAREIDRQAERAGRVMDVLVEVNIGGEESKTGVRLPDLAALLDGARPLRHIRVCGLMAIPPRDAGPERTRAYFAQMRKLFIDIRAEKLDNRDIRVLSMGMSSDYELAVEEGATMVRVGSAIFGARGPAAR